MSCSMSRAPSSLLSSVLVLALASACGEPPADAGPFETSLAPERTVASLTDAEVATFCEESQAYLDRTLSPEERRDLMCTLFAVAFASDAAMCEQTATACAEAPPALTVSCLAEADRSGCDASVAELAACAGDQSAALEEAIELLTCDLAGDSESLAALGTSLQPDSCRRLLAACPALEASMAM